MSSKMEERPEPIGPESATSSVIKLLLFLLGALGISLALYYQLNKVGPFEPHPATGTKLTQLNFQALTGTNDPLTSTSLTGKITLINFWGTWCPPCIAELPEINQLYENHKANPKLQFVSVSCPSPNRTLSHDELKAETQKFLERYGYKFPTYRDANSRNQLHILRQAKLREFAFPTNIVINGECAIVGMWIGYNERVVAQIEQTIDAELAK